MAEKIILQSGAELEVTESDILTQHKLLNAVCQEVKGLDVSPLASGAQVNLNVIKDLFCIMLGSDKIANAIEPMLRRATYNGVKINDFKFFDNEQAKPDFLEVLKEVARVNLAPFGKFVLSQLKAQGVALGTKPATATNTPLK